MNCIIDSSSSTCTETILSVASSSVTSTANTIKLRYCTLPASIAFTVYCIHNPLARYRAMQAKDDRKWFFTFPFLPIPIPNFVTNSHSHAISTGLFPFLPIPISIPKQSFSRCGHEQYSELGSNEITCS